MSNASRPPAHGLSLPLLGLILAGCVSSPLATPRPESPSPELITIEELEARIAGDIASEDPIVQVPEEPDTSATSLETDLDETQSEAGGDSVPAGRWIQQVDRPAIISVNFFNDPLPDVLTLFSEWSGATILSSDETEVRDRRITGDIQAQPWHVALETLLRAHNLYAVQDQRTGIIVVQSEARAWAERDPAMIRLNYVYADDILPTLETIIGSSTNSGDIIQPVSTGSGRSNTLLVYTSPEKLQKVYDMVQRVDRKRPTVSIEARLVFVNRSSMERMGFTYSIAPADLLTGGGGGGDGDDDGDEDGSTPMAQVRPFSQNPYLGGGIPGMPNPGQSDNATLSLMYSLSLSKAINLNVFFDVLTATGMAEVEAAPVITTTSDIEASIEVGEFFILPNTQPIVAGATGSSVNPLAGLLPGQMPFDPYTQQQYGNNQVQPNQGRFPQRFPQTTYTMGGGSGNSGWSNFETGTTLRVTPYVLPNGRVRMDLNVSRDGGTLAPDGQTLTGGRQSTQTEVIVRDNESIVIGGLTVIEKSQSRTGIPVLGDLPILGRLFRTTQEAQLYQDLIIIVTPHVIYDADDDLYFER